MSPSAPKSSSKPYFDKKSRAFSNSVRAHPRVDEYWPTHDDRTTCVWAVRDHLLLTKRAIAARGPDIIATLKKNGFSAKPFTTLFTPLKDKKLPSAADIGIWRLTTRGGGLPPRGSVFAATHALRTGPLRDFVRDVSPNHVLIPAWNGDACPYGPPREYTGPIPPPLPPAATPQGPNSPTMTLIDSGYQWFPHDWGQNPLDQLLGHGQNYPSQASWPDNNGNWYPCPPDYPDAAHPYPQAPQRLDALAGHANHVAGVLAHRTYLPTLYIWNHNGSYVADQTLKHVTTEIAVLRTLLESQKAKPTQVIVLVFAFPPFESVLSVSWDTTMAQLQNLYNHDFVLVAPVGNQGSSQRRYPAALASADPNPTYKPGIAGATVSSANKAYMNVIGVASLDAKNNPSIFTNKNGPAHLGHPPDKWVTCAAVGEEVPSSFLQVNLQPEDATPPGVPAGGHDFAGHGAWALWQGTCFAAPKIAAAIANELQVVGNAMDAWNKAKAAHTVAPSGDVGLIFEDLG